MTLAESSIAPWLTLLLIFSLLWAFARKWLIRVVIFLVAQIILMAIFPIFLVKFVWVVTEVSKILK